MLDLLVAAMLIQAVAFGWYGVLRLTRSVRHTSLTAAAAWAAWFQVTLTVTTIATIAKSRVPPGIIDQLWYLTAVSALCPFAAVLGARRGRLIEWSVFIVLPLIGVLEWPALAQLTRCWHGQRLELETPILIGFGVVMLMSVSNYAVDSKRSFLSSLVFSGTVSLFVVGLSPVLKWQQFAGGSEYLVQLLALFFFQSSAWLFVTGVSHYRNRYFAWDRVWIDFQKFFGTVWASRLMARVNDVAERDKWPWRLTLTGMQPASRNAPHPGSPTADPRVERTFRWLLKPFVDPEWIDERLTASTDHASGD